MSDDERTVFKLSDPFDYDGERVTELRLRKPIVKDLRGLPENKIDQNIKLISRISGQPPPLIDRMSLLDFNAAQVVLQGFLPSGLESGPDSSE